MQWIVNDLSVRDAFVSIDQFFESLSSLLRLRGEDELLRQGLLCSRTLSNQPITPEMTFSKAVSRCDDRNVRSLILAWVSKNGPFWEDDPEDNDDNYFEFGGEDVTDTGIGECARRMIRGKEIAAFSFPGRVNRFTLSPLLVAHGLSDDRIATVPLSNIWCLDELMLSVAGARPVPRTWREAIERFQKQFTKLLIVDELELDIRMIPFSRCAAERIEQLFWALQKYVESRGSDGRHTDETNEVLRDYFTGGKAWFTDESDSNKSDFKNQLKFVDPEDRVKKLFCPFHGKVKTPQLRVHFPWPLEAEKTRLKICYIGPKITKS